MFEKYLFSHVLRGPDGGVGAPAVVETPPADGGSAQEGASEGSGGAKPDESAAAGAKEEQTVPLRVLLQRVGEEKTKRQRETEGREAAERRATEAEALAERLARGEKPDGLKAPVRPAPVGSEDAEIDRRAEQKLFLRDVEAVRDNGVRQYGAAFNETIRALAAVGADSDDFVRQVMAVDPANAHMVLTNLAQDLERTVALVGMNPTRRVMELTKMAMAGTDDEKRPTLAAVPAPKPAAPAKGVSRAPAPPPLVEASTRKPAAHWLADDASKEETDAGFVDMLKRRSGRR